MKNLFLLLGHSVKCWIHKQNFLLYFLWHILILGDDSEIYSLMIQKQSKHIQSGYKIGRKQRQRLIKQYKYKCDCVNKIWFSVLVFPCTNKQTLPNKRDDLFSPRLLPCLLNPVPSGCVSQEGAGSMCCSRQKSQVLVPSQTSPVPCAQYLHRAGNWQELLRAAVTPHWAEWHPKTHEAKFLWYCGEIGDSILLLSDQEIRW